MPAHATSPPRFPSRCDHDGSARTPPHCPSRLARRPWSLARRPPGNRPQPAVPWSAPVVTQPKTIARPADSWRGVERAGSI
eukprot:1970661-Pleurochrysis_carterae.AAC.1